MIENFITSERIYQGEPALEDYLRADQSSFSEVITEAFDEYLCDMKDRQVDLRRLGLRLVIPADETVSEEDTVERRRVVVTSDGVIVLSLLGCNTSDGTFEAIRSIVITEASTVSYLIYTTYKYYKLEVVSGSATYSAYMYETTFDYPLLYLIRSKIFYSIYHRGGDDAFREKAEYYKNEYMAKVANKPASHYYYDIDDSGEITDYEADKATVHKITVRP